MSSAPLSVTVTHDPAEMIALQGEWKDLQERCSYNVLFMTWEWVTAWWEHFGAQGQLWLLQARDRDGRLMGLAPLWLREHSLMRGLRWRQLEFIGATLDVDHLGFVIERGQERAVATAFLRTLRGMRQRWDVLHLSSIPEDSPNLQALRECDAPWKEQIDYTCPYIELPTDFETYLTEMLGARKRKHFRRYERKIQAAYPEPVTYRHVVEPDEIDSTLADLVALHQPRWEEKGHRGAFGDPAISAFFHDAARRFAPQGWVRLYRLDINGQVATVDYVFWYGGRAYAFVGSYNDAFAELSPGQVVIGYMIEAAIAEGIREYDFMRGTEEYKYHWAARDRHEYTLRWLASPGARLQQTIYSTLQALWQGVKLLLPRRLRGRFLDITRS